MKRIVIIRTSSIGDVVLSTVLLDALKVLGLEAKVIWVGRKPSVSLLAAAFPSIETIDIGKKPKISEIKAKCLSFGKVDLVVDLQSNLRSWLISWLLRKSGASSVRARKRGINRLILIFLSRVPRFSRVSKRKKTKPVRQTYLMLETLKLGLKKIGLTYSPKSMPCPSLPIAPTYHGLDPKKKWLAVAPGAAYAPKRAPTEVFAGILNALYDVLGEVSKDLPGLVFVGGVADKLAVEGLINYYEWPSDIKDFSGKLSLEGTASLIGEVEGILTNDSSLGHIAEAVGTPVAVLFGPTSEQFGFAPWRDFSRSFSVPLSCRPCSKHGRDDCRYGDYRCFRDIPIIKIARYISTWYIGKEVDEK